MKKLAFGVVFGVMAASANADFWSNGNLVTNAGAGAGGADISAITADARGATFGLNDNHNGNPPGPFWVSDDFTSGGLWLVSAVHVYAYVFDSATASMNEAYVRIYQGTPDSLTPTLIYGDGTNNRLTGAAFAQSSNGRDIYRTSNAASTATNTQRHIQDVTIGLGAGVALTAGTQYFVEWSLGAGNVTTTTGLSVAPLSLANTNASGPNGLVHYENGQPTGGGDGDPNWGPAAINATNVEGSKVDLPFALDYTVVPEPGTMIAVGAGLVALAARRRRKA